MSPSCLGDDDDDDDDNGSRYLSNFSSIVRINGSCFFSSFSTEPFLWPRKSKILTGKRRRIYLLIFYLFKRCVGGIDNSKGLP